MLVCPCDLMSQSLIDRLGSYMIGSTFLKLLPTAHLHLRRDLSPETSKNTYPVPVHVENYTTSSQICPKPKQELGECCHLCHHQKVLTLYLRLKSYEILPWHTTSGHPVRMACHNARLCYAQIPMKIFFEEFRLMQRSFYQIEWLFSIDFWNQPLKKVEFIICGNDFFFGQAPFIWSEWECDSITNRLLSSTSDFNEILPPFTKIMTLLPIMGHVSSVSSVSSNSNKSFPRDPKKHIPIGSMYAMVLLHIFGWSFAINA